jgi:DNA-binding MarR family transcriptional regulator
MTSKHPADELASLVEKVRACFRELRRTGDDLHEDLGVTAAMRAVMEHIRRNGPATVPDIARNKSVSRQGIQVLVDSLGRSRLASIEPNPAHKRSSLVALTRKGETAFDEILRREHDLLGELAQDRSARSLRSAAAQLAILTDDLKSRR